MNTETSDTKPASIEGSGPKPVDTATTVTADTTTTSEAANESSPTTEATTPETKDEVEVVKEETKQETPLISAPEVPIALAAPTAVSAATKQWVAFVAGIIVALVGSYAYGLIDIADTKGATENYPAVVAKVNGEKISGADLEQTLNQTKNVAASQGADTTSDEAATALVEQAMTVITNTRLLVQVAKGEGYSASDEEVSEQLANIEAQFGGPEALRAEAEKFGLNADDLSTDIAEQILVDKYLRERVSVDDVTIEEAAIVAAYDSVANSGQEVPPLEAVRSAIESQLKGEKQQELIAAHLEELRAQADIEILI